jgi:UPF0716 protein FxsA
MLLKLALFFTLVPLLELGLIIKLSQYIGLALTITLVAITGLVGALLANTQGTRVIDRINIALNQGKMPANHLIDGFLILIGGALLITPGVVTDISGLLFILPFSRPWVKALTKNRLEKLITSGKFQFSAHNKDETKEVDIEFEE